MTAETTFRAKAPGIMAKLLSDFPIAVEDSAAILGNLGHECLGFTAMQEFKPVVAGSKGGFGWPQWTGPRRRAFEAYCKRTGKNPASDDANYSYLFIELKGIEGSEKAAIPKTIAAKGLDAKVIAFEMAFLRAGVKHYPERQQWARIAMDAWVKAAPSRPEVAAPPVSPIPTAPLPPATKTKGFPVWIIPAVLVVAAVVYFLFIKR